MLDVTSAPDFKCEPASSTERNTPVTPDRATLCASQAKIEITFDDEGNAAITQSSWPDEDQTILISRDNISSFLDRLCDALGVMSVGHSS
jgi:hypothetical protein